MTHTKHILWVVLINLSVAVRAQSTYTLSLSKESIDPGPLKYTIVKVVDKREIKTTIGIVQLGISNKLTVSDFERPVETEVMDLINRSGHNQPGDFNMVMSIHQLEVREVLERHKEGAVAELTVDYFLVFNDSLYYITRQYGVQRSTGQDVTHKHDTNIALTVENVLNRFNEYDLENHVISEPALAWSELSSYQPTPPEPLYAILQAHDFPDGIYTTFIELRDNNPSMREGYVVEEGTSLEVKWVDEKGHYVRKVFPYFALAYNQALYVNFEESFYKVERRSNTLIFFGPGRPSPGQNSRALYLGGLAGLALASAGTNVRMAYEIDLNTGAFKEITFTR